MTIALSKNAQAIIDAAVASGQFASPEAVVEAGLALLAERRMRYEELRQSIQAAIAEGGRFTSEEVAASVEEELDKWERERAMRPRAAE